MPAWQFETHLNPDQTFTVPPEIVAQLTPDVTVQVFLTTAESVDENDWRRLAAEQFLQITAIDRTNVGIALAQYSSGW